MHKLLVFCYYLCQWQGYVIPSIWLFIYSFVALSVALQGKLQVDLAEIFKKQLPLPVALSVQIDGACMNTDGPGLAD